MVHRTTCRTNDLQLSGINQFTIVIRIFLQKALENVSQNFEHEVDNSTISYQMLKIQAWYAVSSII